MRESKDKILFN